MEKREDDGCFKNTCCIMSGISKEMLEICLLLFRPFVVFYVRTAVLSCQDENCSDPLVLHRDYIPSFLLNSLQIAWKLNLKVAVFLYFSLTSKRSWTFSIQHLSGSSTTHEKPMGFHSFFFTYLGDPKSSGQPAGRLLRRRSDPAPHGLPTLHDAGHHRRAQRRAAARFVW